MYLYMNLLLGLFLSRTKTNVGALLNLKKKKKKLVGFPGGSVVKNLSDNAGDMGSNPDLGRSHMLGST